MKTNIKQVLVALCTIVCMGSCAAKTNDDKSKTEDMKTDGKQLVVFFSHTGENYNVGNIEKGNTHIVADFIAEATGAEIFEIKPKKGYPFSYDECIEVAKEELHNNARPAIAGDVKVEDYDTIYIGYPQWWGEPPMCVYTFIDGHDWEGKTVIPFVTHEGSGMGSTDRKIAKACKGSNTLVGKGLAIQGKVAQTQRDKTKELVNNWLEKL